MIRKDLLFKKVKCNGYYKPVKDGRRIEIDTENNTAAYMVYDRPYEKECTATGEVDFKKIQYEHISKSFEGCIIGTKKIITSKYLVVDRNIDTNEIYVRNDKCESIECFIVYYCNNHKRYVPIDDIQE